MSRARLAVAGEQGPEPADAGEAAPQGTPRQAERARCGPRGQTDTAEKAILAMISTGLLAPGDLVPATAVLTEAIPDVSKAGWNQAKIRLLRKGTLTRPGLKGPMEVAAGPVTSPPEPPAGEPPP